MENVNDFCHTIDLNKTYAGCILNLIKIFTYTLTCMGTPTYTQVSKNQQENIQNKYKYK